MTLGSLWGPGSKNGQTQGKFPGVGGARGCLFPRCLGWTLKTTQSGKGRKPVTSRLLSFCVSKTHWNKGTLKAKAISWLSVILCLSPNNGKVAIKVYEAASEAKVGSSQRFDDGNASRNSIRLAPLHADFSKEIALCAPQTQLQWGLHDLFDFGPINKESGTWPWNSFYTRCQRSILRWRLTGFPHEINTCHNTAMKKRREIHPRPWAIKIQEMNQHGDNPEFGLTSLPTSKYDRNR